MHLDGEQRMRLHVKTMYRQLKYNITQKSTRHARELKYTKLRSLDDDVAYLISSTMNLIEAEDENDRKHGKVKKKGNSTGQLNEGHSIETIVDPEDTTPPNRRDAICEEMERYIMNDRGMSLRKYRKYLVTFQVLQDLSLL